MISATALDALQQMRKPASTLDRPGDWPDVILQQAYGACIVEELIRAGLVRRGGSPTHVPAKVRVEYAANMDRHSRVVARLGREALHDVILEDAHGLTQVDHLVLGVQAIVVLETKTYRGLIMGDTHRPEWTQVLAKGSIQYSFQNPLRQNHRHCKAVEAKLPPESVPVLGYVVSAGKARFCEALEAVVVPVERLADLFAPNARCDALPAALGSAWQRLRDAAVIGELRREEHAELIRKAYGVPVLR